MGREKDRKLRRRRRRQVKVHKLKARIAQAKDLKERQLLVRKLLKISLYPPVDIHRE